jgi:hypothetical protein
MISKGAAKKIFLSAVDPRCNAATGRVMSGARHGPVPASVSKDGLAACSPENRGLNVNNAATHVA